MILKDQNRIVPRYLNTEFICKLNQGLHSEVTSEMYSKGRCYRNSKTSQLKIHGKFLKKYMRSKLKAEDFAQRQIQSPVRRLRWSF